MKIILFSPSDDVRRMGGRRSDDYDVRRMESHDLHDRRKNDDHDHGDHAIPNLHLLIPFENP